MAYVRIDRGYRVEERDCECDRESFEWVGAALRLTTAISSTWLLIVHRHQAVSSSAAAAAAVRRHVTLERTKGKQKTCTRRKWWGEKVGRRICECKKEDRTERNVCGCRDTRCGCQRGSDGCGGAQSTGCSANVCTWQAGGLSRVIDRQ